MLVNIGFDSYISADKIAVVSPLGSNPVRRTIQEQQGRVIDISKGRKTKSVIFLCSGQVVLSALAPETISKRINEEAI